MIEYSLSEVKIPAATLISGSRAEREVDLLMTAGDVARRLILRSLVGKVDVLQLLKVTLLLYYDY